MWQLFLGNTGSRVFYVEIETFLIGSESEGNTAFLGELQGIRHKIGYHLCKPVSVCMHGIFLLRSLPDNLHSTTQLGHPHTELLFQIEHHLVDVHIREHKFQCSGFYLREVQNISNQLLQHFIVTLHNFQELYLLLVCRCRGQQFRESDNCVQRGTDFMAHIRQEHRFGAVGILCLLTCQFQFSFHLFQPGNVMHGNHHAVAVLNLHILAGNISIAFRSSAFAIPKIQNSCQIREVLLHHKGILYGIPHGAVLTQIVSAATSCCRQGIVTAQNISHPSSFGRLYSSGNIVVIGVEYSEVAVYQQYIGVQIPHNRPEQLVGHFHKMLF